MSVFIKDLSHYLPENLVTNQDIIDKNKLKITSRVVEKVIGIKTRFWASPTESVSDLAVKACQKIDLSKFDGPIFLSTITGDYLSPSTSSIIKQKLGLSGDAPTFDLNAACAGNLFALDLATKYLTGTEYKQALVIASECRSRFTNLSDRKTAFLFSDAASAILLENSEVATNTIEWIDTNTRASEQFEIFIPAGGASSPMSQESIQNKDHYIKMQDGSKIKDVTTSVLVDKIKSKLADENQTLDDFDQFVFHQGKGILILEIASRLGISEDKVHINFPEYGNSSSASVGVSLSEYIQNKDFASEPRVLIMAMGAGYHIGMASIKWRKS